MKVRRPSRSKSVATEDNKAMGVLAGVEFEGFGVGPAAPFLAS
jgi:hypothetical protein